MGKPHAALRIEDDVLWHSWDGTEWWSGPPTEITLRCGAGACLAVIFSGHDAERRAREYWEWRRDKGGTGG